MEQSSQAHSEHVAQEVVVLSAREQVLQLYPKAVCYPRKSWIKDFFQGSFVIYTDKLQDEVLGASYVSEEVAWNWTLAKINKSIMDKLSQ